MIQRKQSLYLILIAFTIVFAWVLNIKICGYTVSIEGLATDIRMGFLSTEFTNVSLEKSGVEVVKSKVDTFYNLPLITLMSVSLILTIISLFLFKKLKLQKQILTFHYLIIALIFFYVYYTHAELVKQFPSSNPKGFVATTMIILLLPIFNWLSIKYIKKDIELLASVDRLR